MNNHHGNYGLAGSLNYYATYENYENPKKPYVLAQRLVIQKPVFNKRVKIDNHGLGYNGLGDISCKHIIRTGLMWVFNRKLSPLQLRKQR